MLLVLAFTIITRIIEKNNATFIDFNFNYMELTLNNEKSNLNQDVTSFVSYNYCKDNWLGNTNLSISISWNPFLVMQINFESTCY